MGDQPVSRPLPTRDNTDTEQSRYPCLEWDSSQQSHYLENSLSAVSGPGIRSDNSANIKARGSLV
jgi:hypothetical protein